MAYKRFRDDREYSDQALLEMARNMLCLAMAEQVNGNRKKKWLVNNTTLKKIIERVESFGDAIY